MDSPLFHTGVLIEGFGICLPTALLLVAYSLGGLPSSLNFVLPTSTVATILIILSGTAAHLFSIIRAGPSRLGDVKRLQWASAILGELALVSIFFNILDRATASLACGPPGSEARCYEASLDLTILVFLLGVLLFNMGTLGSLQIWSWKKTRSATRSESRID